MQANNLAQSPHSEMMFDTAQVTRAVTYAISDSGATGHSLVEDAPVVNKKLAVKPIQILLPNGKTIVSTHTGNLDIPWLPDSMTEAHIVPGLSHSSLISTRKFCDAGCRVSLMRKNAGYIKEENWSSWEIGTLPHNSGGYLSIHPQDRYGAQQY